MRNVIHALGRQLPDGKIKDAVRRTAFPGIFLTWGTHAVRLGPSWEKIPALAARFLFYSETLGEREMEGYLQHYTPQPGHTVVNAGGYHGYFAVYLAHKVTPKGRVIVFEPDIINLRVLRHNIKVNNLSNVTIVPKGLWSHDTQLAFATMGSGSRIATAGSVSHKISACALDNELRRLGIGAVDFVSMDIEGAEIKAVQGAQHTIATNPHIQLAIASYHSIDGAQTAARVEQELRTLGLHTHTAFPRHLTTYGSAL